ncbi:type I restriction-modification system subunit M N-terminal domain-containing protein [Gordonia aquimaris]|uniref:site-specific DNA-methyltransferase (adenine-specific) n=1 Tax=Gordonia aquimaris TaxID=2984863 RepID=A0A9X3I7E6_9ACTN|nr:type I restriction-modification system subunit M N-terminal domain-containing protein [Gordonia aquimaris]MCX2966494.1 type I restriction-modification system subunit M N-terminal domain-containing protein [Gordonia aquimaris]
MAESAEASRKTTARIVWDTADKFLRNIVDEEDYGDYILPFTVLRRLECMLADSKDDVIKYVGALAGMPHHLIDIAVKDKFGLSFYNVSRLDLATIASVDDNVDRSLKSYIDGFSNNIADIWVSFDFTRRVKVLADANRLHAVVKHFSTLDLSPRNLSNTGMGDVFEDVMYRAFNKKGKAAGAFYTPRDAIQLMVDVLIARDDDTLAGESALRSIYDPTAGSGGPGGFYARSRRWRIDDDRRRTRAGPRRVRGRRLVDGSAALDGHRSGRTPSGRSRQARCRRVSRWSRSDRSRRAAPRLRSRTRQRERPRRRAVRVLDGDDRHDGRRPRRRPGLDRARQPAARRSRRRRGGARIHRNRAHVRTHRCRPMATGVRLRTCRRRDGSSWKKAGYPRAWRCSTRR